MKVGVAKETAPGERRVALVPEALGRLTAAGLEILVESGAGAGALIPDQAYADAGATIVSSVELYGQSDVILRVQKPSDSEVKVMRAGQAGQLLDDAKPFAQDDPRQQDRARGIERRERQDPQPADPRLCRPRGTGC